MRSFKTYFDKIMWVSRLPQKSVNFFNVKGNKRQRRDKCDLVGTPKNSQFF